MLDKRPDMQHTNTKGYPIIFKLFFNTKYFCSLGIVLFTTAQTFAQQYNIKDFGAVNDTNRLSTAAINKAIETCSANGGGKVVVPPGNYKSGTLVLKNHVTLELQRGAVLYASTNPDDFPRQKQPIYRSQKDPGGWFALIYAEGAEDIGIVGEGKIDGQGAKQKSRPELLGGDRDGRPRNILLISCKNVTVKDITMMNAGIWNQHYLDCEDVMVDNIRVYNHSNKNNDGIDIDGCRRFVLSNSIIDSDDDGIVMKSTGPAGCEDIAINNCIISSFTNAIKCGTESTGGFKNITITNCVIKPSISKLKSVFGFGPSGITGISLEIVDGGIMDGVVINNISIAGTDCPIYVRLGNRGRKHREDAPVPTYGAMRNVQISNVVAHSAGNYSSSITGVPGSLIENISLTNILVVNKGGLKAGEYLPDPSAVKEDEKGYPEPTVWKNLPSYGFFIRHVKEISLSAISLKSKEADPRYPLIAVDVEYLKVRDFGVGNGDSRPLFLFKDVNRFSSDEKIKVKREK